MVNKISESESGLHICSVLNDGFTTRIIRFAKVAAMLEQKDVARLFLKVVSKMSTKTRSDEILMKHDPIVLTEVHNLGGILKGMAVASWQK
jgi:hypothetical protein